MTGMIAIIYLSIGLGVVWLVFLSRWRSPQAIADNRDFVARQVRSGRCGPNVAVLSVMLATMILWHDVLSAYGPSD